MSHNEGNNGENSSSENSSVDPCSKHCWKLAGYLIIFSEETFSWKIICRLYSFCLHFLVTCGWAHPTVNPPADKPMIFFLYQHIVTELICRGIWHQKVIQWLFFRLDPSHGKKFYGKTNKVVTIPKDQQESDSYIFA